MQGMILAAGMGKRLKDLTQDNTKCMVKVNGVTMIERVLHQLDALKLSKIVIVVGYEGQKLIDYIATLNIHTPIHYVNNPIYDKTNNIYSLALAKDYLIEEDTLLLESDLIFEDDVLRVLLDDPRDTLALVDKYESWMDGTCVKIGEDDSIESFVPGSKFIFDDRDQYYKTVNIYKFSKHFSESHYVPFLDAYTKALGNNEYYEQVLRVITMLDEPEIKAKKLNGQLWYEIDDIQDLDIASSMFASSSNEKLTLIQNRYGGYWRYPKLLDFCYLVNPYFPPQKMMDEMKASFETLITQYPSGMRINSLLAAKNFGIKQEHIVIGNGAAELIKCLMERTTGKVGFIRPTFEEYPNRYTQDNSIIFSPDNPDFSYNINDLIKFFGSNTVNTIVLINPDNPSGNYIPKSDMLKFADWCENNNICLIADESFVDFANEKDNSLIHEEILTLYKNMIVIKSISKSYGIPGIRLGIMASGNEEIISSMKKEVGIWNINSFGEFYMQIAEKYKKYYDKSLIKIKESRENFVKGLNNFTNIRVIPSQANYLMIELLGDITATELTEILLTKYNIFIKDLSGKIHSKNKQYIRVAVRDENDNGLLLSALKEIL